MKGTSVNDFIRRHKALWRLIDNKDDIIEQWARELGRSDSPHSPLAQLGLTIHQRRVIAALRWEREVAKLQDPRDGLTPRTQQPPPVAGLDANKRVVVQRIKNGKLEMWALTKYGAPFDIKPPVRSLKDGRLVKVPPHIYTIESE